MVPIGSRTDGDFFSSLWFFAAAFIGLGMLLGCAADPAPKQGAWVTPAQHAVSQVRWLKSRAGRLSAAELQLLQQVPWRANGTTDRDRQTMFDLASDGEVIENRMTKRRLLGRPRAMDAATEVLRKEWEQQRLAMPALAKDQIAEKEADDKEANSRGMEIIPATTGLTGEDGGRR